MNIRKAWGEIIFSEYRLYMIQLQWPSDGWDEYCVRLVFAFWRFYISINLWRTKPWKDFETQAPRYGVSFHDSIIWLSYGADRSFNINMPWKWEIVRHDLLYPNGEVYHRNKYPMRTPAQKKREITWYDVFEKHSNRQDEVQVLVAKFITLTRHTKDGRKQIAKIRLTGEEREWRWRWFKWLPWPNLKQRVVNCDSDVELGERAGSWKGGMMGWSIPWEVWGRGILDPSIPWETDDTMQRAFWKWYKTWDGN
jgi:hypothetical protein